MKYVAHIRLTDQKEQTVAEHCQQTAKMAEQYGQAIGLPNTARLAGLLHDIGKLTCDFNDYIHGITDFRRGELDHSFAGAKYLQSLIRHEDDSARKQTAKLVGRVVLSHHGLNDWLDEDASDTFQRRIEKEKHYEEILRNVHEQSFLSNIDTLLSDAAFEISLILKKLQSISVNAESYAFYLGMLERLLQSVLIDADRTDTADFMSAKQTEEHINVYELWGEMQIKMQQKLKVFSERTDNISVQRKSISKRCAAFAEHDVHICKLIVPTGGGKTLSSLRFAIEYAKRHSNERIFYIAPFMSILEQNSDVIRGIAGETAFLEHHSDMISELSDDHDRLHEYELSTEKWDSPVIATTMVQFLNALFSGKSSSVRHMHRLSNAVIIVDEVQSVPLKCVYLFNLAMNFLSQICGTTIVLCSATQPTFELLDKFPLLLDQNNSMTGDTVADFELFRRTKLIYQKKTGGFSYDEAADFCLDRFKENGNLLLIVNTKASAKEMYQRLKSTEQADVFHLSTNMCAQHRRECIARIKTALAAKEPVICVTTQLIEAGVDISFGCVVRSLAGMDNAAQAAGRCNRNGEYQKERPVYELFLFEEKLGNLSEIKNAQDISMQMMDISNDTDYLSVPVMSDYFKKVYRIAQSGNNRDQLRYPLPNPTDRDLLNLLSLNQYRIQKNRNRHLKYCGQAFKTAGRLFQVIDSNTMNVIVPYNEDAEDLISALRNIRDPNETIKLIRKAQIYSVGIYAGTEKALKRESAIYAIQCGYDQQCCVYVLEKQFYDAEFGITLKGGEQELLIV